MQKYGLQANGAEGAKKKVPCQVCDDPNPVYAWTDYSGEGYCLRCGIPYQLQWGGLKEGESYPRINIDAKAVPMFRRYFAETGQPAGYGTFISFGEYPEVRRARESFGAWWKEHMHEFPELQS